MEATVDKLEAMFQKTESDLDYISRKLDAEFADSSDDKNPAKLVEKIGEIKHEFAQVAKEAQGIKEAQKEAMDFFRDQLMTMCTALTKLQTSSGQGGNKPEELSQLEDILGIQQSSSDFKDKPLSENHSEGMTTPPQTYNDFSVDDEEHCTPAKPSPEPMSPFTRRKDASSFIEVDEAEFESVSTLVRGRVKLPEVNHTYRILWTYFKEERKSAPLSPTDMFKMGLRVSGQTGEAKLKVLRALKLLEIDRKGNVKLL